MVKQLEQINLILELKARKSESDKLIQLHLDNSNDIQRKIFELCKDELFKLEPKIKKDNFATYSIEKQNCEKSPISYCVTLPANENHPKLFGQCIYCNEII